MEARNGDGGNDGDGDGDVNLASETPQEDRKSSDAEADASSLDGFPPEPEVRNSEAIKRNPSRTVRSKRDEHMVYEGDDEWDRMLKIEISGQSNPEKGRMIRARAGLTTGNLTDGHSPAETAAVSSGLRFGIPEIIERIKFREYFQKNENIKRYLDCRNQILALWQENTSHTLSFSECEARLGLKFGSILSQIFDFLDQHAYINFGFTEADAEFFPQKVEEFKSNANPKIQNYENRLLNEVNEGKPRNSLTKSSLQGNSIEKVDFPSDKGREGYLGSVTSTTESLSNYDSKIVASEVGGNSTFSSRIHSGVESDQSNKEGETRVKSILNGTSKCDESNHEEANTDSMCHISQRINHDTIQVEGISINNERGTGNQVTQSSLPHDSSQNVELGKKKVIVVGAGASGLAAARNLKKLNFDVLVLEARGRVGGRVNTDKTTFSAPVDLGASIITGVEADVVLEKRPDPSALMFQQLKIEYVPLRGDCPLYDSVTGDKVVAEIDAEIEREYNALLDDTVNMVLEKGEIAEIFSLGQALEEALKKRRLKAYGDGRGGAKDITKQTNKEKETERELQNEIVTSFGKKLKKIGIKKEEGFVSENDRKDKYDERKLRNHDHRIMGAARIDEIRSSEQTLSDTYPTTKDIGDHEGDKKFGSMECFEEGRKVNNEGNFSNVKLESESRNPLTLFEENVKSKVEVSEPLILSREVVESKNDLEDENEGGDKFVTKEAMNGSDDDNGCGNAIESERYLEIGNEKSEKNCVEVNGEVNPSEEAKAKVMDNLSSLQSEDEIDLEYLGSLERRVLDWHFANLEYGCASKLDCVSLPHWNQDDVFGGFGGDHCMVKGGYGQLLDFMAKDLNIKLNCVISKIEYGDAEGGIRMSNPGDETKPDLAPKTLDKETEGMKVKGENEIDLIGSNRSPSLDEKNSAPVKVYSSSGEIFECDAVLVTVPLGCLKNNDIIFSPPLPDWKTKSVKNLGFGVLNKLVMEFPHTFWDSSVDFFGVTGKDTSSRGKFFMFWNLERVCGYPILTSLLAGESAELASTERKEDLVSEAVSVLKNLFGENSVPEPVASFVTDWKTDPFSRGAYSFVAVGASGNDYYNLSIPVCRKIFFSGEATCREHPDTVGGAILSGVRESIRIFNHFQSNIDIFEEEKNEEKLLCFEKLSEIEENDVKNIKLKLEEGGWILGFGFRNSWEEASSREKVDRRRLSDTSEEEGCKKNVKVEDGSVSVECLEGLSERKTEETNKNSERKFRKEKSKEFLMELFENAKTFSGKILLAKEALVLPSKKMTTIFGNLPMLSCLNSWMEDSLNKDDMQLLQLSLKIILIAANDLSIIKSSGIGKTIKHRVCAVKHRAVKMIVKDLIKKWLFLFKQQPQQQKYKQKEYSTKDKGNKKGVRKTEEKSNVKNHKPIQQNRKSHSPSVRGSEEKSPLDTAKKTHENQDKSISSNSQRPNGIIEPNYVDEPTDLSEPKSNHSKENGAEIKEEKERKMSQAEIEALRIANELATAALQAEKALTEEIEKSKNMFKIPQIMSFSAFSKALKHQKTDIEAQKQKEAFKSKERREEEKKLKKKHKQKRDDHFTEEKELSLNKKVKHSSVGKEMSNPAIHEFTSKDGSRTSGKDVEGIKVSGSDFLVDSNKRQHDLANNEKDKEIDPCSSKKRKFSEERGEQKKEMNNENFDSTKSFVDISQEKFFENVEVFVNEEFSEITSENSKVKKVKFENIIEVSALNFNNTDDGKGKDRLHENGWTNVNNDAPKVEERCDENTIIKEKLFHDEFSESKVGSSSNIEKARKEGRRDSVSLEDESKERKEADSDREDDVDKQGRDKKCAIKSKKKLVREYVIQLLLPLLKEKKIDKSQFKEIARKTTEKVMEHYSMREKDMEPEDFLIPKRKERIRSLMEKYVKKYVHS